MIVTLIALFEADWTLICLTLCWCSSYICQGGNKLSNERGFLSIFFMQICKSGDRNGEVGNITKAGENGKYSLNQVHELMKYLCRYFDLFKELKGNKLILLIVSKQQLCFIIYVYLLFITFMSFHSMKKSDQGGSQHN